MPHTIYVTQSKAGQITFETKEEFAKWRENPTWDIVKWSHCDTDYNYYGEDDAQDELVLEDLNNCGYLNI